MHAPKISSAEQQTTKLSKQMHLARCEIKDKETGTPNAVEQSPSKLTPRERNVTPELERAVADEASQGSEPLRELTDPEATTFEAAWGLPLDYPG
jgi:hypothetical protein